MTNTAAATVAAKKIAAPRPRFGTIPAASRYSGVGRTKLYDKAREVPGLFKKWDGRTLVDFDVLDLILDGLPQAGQMRRAPPQPRKRANFRRIAV